MELIRVLRRRRDADDLLIKQCAGKEDASRAIISFANTAWGGDYRVLVTAYYSLGENKHQQGRDVCELVQHACFPGSNDFSDASARGAVEVCLNPINGLVGHTLIQVNGPKMMPPKIRIAGDHFAHLVMAKGPVPDQNGAGPVKNQAVFFVPPTARSATTEPTTQKPA